ncbi:hypothetical protein TorRG33x02_136510 [Trema orientale]|uniref:DUF4283 domain-containing protein n=1 Tax=Trema orientale TaxID=63057 RepID=A0A2P5EYI3_TREOI|nr:hypothetical protein TorRG33x02_136510 [Trema orientale]
MYQDGKENMDLCLVGRVFGNKIVNRKGLSEVADYVWHTSRKVRVEAIEVSNFFMFHFGSKSDRQRILSGGPWNFGNQLISLLKPQGVGLVSSMDFTKVPFWVQFHNVPIVCRSDRCARKSSNSSGGANHNNTDVFDRGLNSDEENTRVAAMEAGERKIFGSSNIDGTSKVTKKSALTRIDGDGERRAEKNLLKRKNKVGASSGVASGEASYINPDQVVDIQVTITTNTYPIYNMEEPNILLQTLISSPESKQDVVSTRKACTWKRVSRGSPNKTKTKKKQSGGLAAPITISPFVKNLKHISPKHNRSHSSPRDAKLDGSQSELAKPSVKRHLSSSFLELSSDETVKRGKVVANKVQNMDVVESASPVSQNR